ncbi:DUF1553 domain-containing protein [Maioricimonas sp. JC845]|uniref:DUF1553 domain-containing protein n=1 Tax=Maioricimonas sp. JC845 TaxID=3232138 RepID=UPI0034586684
MLLCNRCRVTATFLLTTLVLSALSSATAAEDQKTPPRDYEAIIHSDGPVAWWRFHQRQPGEDNAQVVVNAGEGGEALDARTRGLIRFNAAGPRPGEYPDFTDANEAANLAGGRNFLIVKDAGEGSAVDFDNGDAITMEAWIRWDEALRGSYPYIFSKGRTHNPGTPANNQNYSLRLATQGGGPFISFFFCDAETPNNKGGIGPEGHRWTSTTGVPNDGAWHHVAVTYVFGEPDSLRGYIDGKPVKGRWDMAGPTTKRPIVDDDELWIGSAMGGGSGFGGMIDEVALYRKALTAEQIANHVRINLAESEYALGKIREDEVPDDVVRVEILERVPVERSWNFRMRKPTHLLNIPVFALSNLPQKYNERGLIADRPVPWMLHMTSRIHFEPGTYELVYRSLDSARLYIDGEMQAETPWMKQSSSAHQPLHKITPVPEGVLSIPVAHYEEKVQVTFDEPGDHVISLYRMIGSKRTGIRIGELVVGMRRIDENTSDEAPKYTFLSPKRRVPFTDGAWLDLAEEEHQRLRHLNQQNRLAAAQDESEYWNRRHAWARQNAPAAVEVPDTEDVAVFNDIDRFINRRLQDEGVKPQPLIDDYGFLRRLALDTVGRIPTEEEIESYFADSAEDRRSNAIARYLASPEWADHWVGYWQDVLAENPGLTKPMLNNTGPFRWFIHEAFLDNKSFDRFVTELVSMDGSRTMGGPAGFAIASQNDVPMAAKAHIVGTAFLGVEMKCARCHDAPYHDVKQEDLFNLAAMLNRGSLKVPGSSSLPAGQLENSVVQVTLEPGSSVKPDWPFAEFSSDIPELPEWMIRNPSDPRERLAATLTLPQNPRFARVLVNRLWQRYVGRALIEPVSDWEGAECSHPDLLDYLARELVLNDYDLKYMARLIFESNTYQRQVAPDVTRESEEAALFAGPVRRTLTGEQLTDSLYLASGKGFGSEELTMDADGRLPHRTFLDMGIPHRAWEFVAVSNERDRPSMSLHVAQSIVDLMAAYGWRQQRQEPLTIREESITPLQPMVLANGTASHRALDLTDGSELTNLTLEDQPLEQLIEKLYLRFLSRTPTSDERELFVELLRPGYDERIVAGPEAVPPRKIHRSPRAWSNHLHVDATTAALKRQADVLAGDPPTRRLDADWRTRFEDAAWALVNSPEFVFVP